MTENRASYPAQGDAEADPDDVQHISEIIDQLVEQQDWSSHLAKVRNGQYPPSANGHRRG